MVVMMLRSVEEVAQDLKVSKTAIYNKLKLKEYKSLVLKKHGKAMIDDELFNLIKDSFKVKSCVENDCNNKSCNAEISVTDTRDLNLNKDWIIENLMEQLRAKDKQIFELHKLIENNQVLLKNSQKQQQDQLQLEEHFKELDEKLQDLKSKMTDKKTKKRKLFKFFSEVT